MQCTFTGGSLDFTQYGTVIGVYGIVKERLKVFTSLEGGDICIYLMISRHKTVYILEHYENEFRLEVAPEVHYSSEFLDRLFMELRSMVYGGTSDEVMQFVERNSQSLNRKLMDIRDSDSASDMADTIACR
jgi:hypothetical protein